MEAAFKPPSSIFLSEKLSETIWSDRWNRSKWQIRDKIPGSL